MSWIKDIQEELEHLDLSIKKLRPFGIFIGVFLALISLWGYWRSHSEHWLYFIMPWAALLILCGSLFPGLLKNIYKIWMSLAFILGWFVSRILLIFIFYLILTPIGFIAKMVGKKWMDIDFNQKRDTYWIERDRRQSIDYEKMY